MGRVPHMLSAANPVVSVIASSESCWHAGFHGTVLCAYGVTLGWVSHGSSSIQDLSAPRVQPGWLTLAPLKPPSVPV